MTDIAALGLKVEGVGNVDSATKSLNAFAKAEVDAKGASVQLEQQSKKTSREVSQLASAAKAAGGVFVAAFSVASLKNYADTWSDLQSRVGAATGDMAGAANQMHRLVDIANASYSSLEQTVSAYAGNVQALRDLGKSSSQAADYTEALNHMLVLTATRGERAASVQNALSKAMAVGKLQADGLETVLANGGEVAAALAKELGTTVSGLRSLASDGKITGEVIANAIIKPLDDVRERAAEMPATVGDAMTRVTTNFTEFVGVLDKTSGASAAAATGIIELADGMRALSTNKEALDTIIIAGETLAVVLGARLVTAGLASAGSFAVMQVAALRAAGGINAMALAGRAASGALALVGGPLGLLVTAVGVGALAWSHYGKSARDNADAGVLGLVDTKKSVDELITEFQKLNNLQRERTLAIKQEDLKEATKEASKAVFDLGNAFKPAMDKGTRAAAQFRADFTADIKAVTSDTTLSADEMANAMAALVQAYIDNGKASEGSKTKLLEMAQAAVQSADQVRTLRQEVEGLNAASQLMGPPVSAMNAPRATRTTTSTGGSKKEDPGVTLIKQMRERIALIGKESEYEQLLAKIRVGSIKFSTEAQKQQALAHAQTIDFLQDLEQQAKNKEKLDKEIRERTLQAEADKTNALMEMQEKLRATSDKYGADLAGYGMGANAAYQMKERLSIEVQQQQQLGTMRRQFGEELRKAETDAERAQLEGMFAERLSLTQQGFDQELALYDLYVEQKRTKDADYMAGWQASLETYLENSENLYALAGEQMTGFLGTAQSSISGAFMSMLDGTKSVGDAFQDMAANMGRAVVNALVDMAAQWLVYQAVQLVVGKTTAAASGSILAATANANALMAGINAFASTAAIPIVGPALAPAAMGTALAVTMPMAAAVSALSLSGMAHDGIDAVPETGTWLLEKGERVTTANTSARLDSTLARIDSRMSGNSGGGMGSPNVNLNVQLVGGAFEGAQVTQEYDEDQEAIILRVVSRDIAEGGPISRSGQRYMGWNRVGT